MLSVASIKSELVGPAARLPERAATWHLASLMLCTTGFVRRAAVAAFGDARPRMQPCYPSAQQRSFSGSSTVARTHEITLRTRTRLQKQVLRNVDHHAANQGTDRP